MIYRDLQPGDYPRGRIVPLRQQAAGLENNILGQSPDLRHDIYLPPGYDEDDPGMRLPVFVCLAAYTNAGPGLVAWRNHGETVPQRLDRLIAEGAMGPVIVVFPNAWNALGGNQYVNSTTIGPWADIIGDDLPALVDERFRTLGAGYRAVFGKSSGGFGALHLALQKPGAFAAVAAHAADMAFDVACLPDFPATCRVLEQYDYDLPGFVRRFWRRKKADYREFHALMTLCLAASYDPQPELPLGLRLPFSTGDCHLCEAAWENWLRFDPVCRPGSELQLLDRLAGLWIDVGKNDQYNLQFGARRLERRLEQLAIRHQYEEFEGDHSGMDWRLDESLPYLYRRIMANEQG